MTRRGYTLMQVAQGLGLGSVVLWIFGLIVGAIVLGVIVLAAKRRLFEDDESTATPWTLHDITKLRDSGEITIEQYEKLKERIVRQVRGVAQPDSHAPNEPKNGL